MCVSGREECLYKADVRRRREPSEWKRIREVFLRGRRSYDVTEVADLLGISRAAVQAAIDDGTVSREIAWEDVVTLGLEHRWTYRMLTAALRGVDGAALPPLVRVVTRPVLLPRYQWQVLRHLASRRSQSEGREITVSDLIEDAISTAVLMRLEEWEALETELPGVRAAAEWPCKD